MFAIEVAAGTPVDRAYVGAGYTNSKWARPNGAKLAQHPKVAARISELQAEYAVRGGLSAQYIQARLLPLIEGDLRQLFEKGPDGIARLRNLTDLPDGIAAALASVKVDENGGIAEFKLASRIEAAKTLLQSIGAIAEQHQHVHMHDPDGLAARIEAAFRRLDAIRGHLGQDREFMGHAVEIAEVLLKEDPEKVRELADAIDPPQRPTSEEKRDDEA